jgi:ribosomal subunit interface protein
MPLRVSGKNLDIGEALRTQAEGRVAAALAKYFDGDYSGHVTVMRDGTGFRTECVIHLDSGVTLEASNAAHDAYASLDQAADHVEKRLRRYKRRLKERHAGADERAG